LFRTSLLPYSSHQDWAHVVGVLAAWADGRPAADLFRISPRALASALNVDFGLLTDAFLAAVLEGWFDLRWDYHCPHCQGVAHFDSHLKAARSQNHCPTCRVDFRNELDHNVEVTFTASPKLASFAAGELEALEARPAVPEPRLTGLDVLHRPLFRLRFSDEVLSAEESLEIRQVVFLFTDIRGSTALYEQLGDARAYNLVREHFKVLFRAVEDHGGVVVKTIGDAVMASFRSPSAALEAALNGQAAMVGLKVPGTDEAVVVKMGLHGGPAIAVTLNDRFDYFGQTVNRAARVQGLAKNQEIYFSDAVFQNPACRTLLAARKTAVRRWKAQLKGIEGDHIVYSVQ